MRMHNRRNLLAAFFSLVAIVGHVALANAHDRLLYLDDNSIAGYFCEQEEVLVNLNGVLQRRAVLLIRPNPMGGTSGVKIDPSIT